MCKGWRLGFFSYLCLLDDFDDTVYSLEIQVKTVWAGHYVHCFLSRAVNKISLQLNFVSVHIGLDYMKGLYDVR
jgi:hypothetical protein